MNLHIKREIVLCFDLSEASDLSFALLDASKLANNEKAYEFAIDLLTAIEKEMSKIIKEIDNND